MDASSLARHFRGTVSFETRPLTLAFSRIGLFNEPALIVTSIRDQVGMILRPDPNEGRWFNIYKANFALDTMGRVNLEKQLNAVIREQGSVDQAVSRKPH
jgi:hypothetical protein